MLPKLKLSEAIKRAQIMGVPQTRYRMYSLSANALHACALGQALLGAGLVTEGAARRMSAFATCEDELAQWPATQVRVVACANDNGKTLTEIVNQLEFEGL